MSLSYSNKNDFDDMNVYHQTKSSFKNEKQGLVKMQNSRRSTFIDCFTGDSVVAPATICPKGVNSTKNFPCIDESNSSQNIKDPRVVKAEIAVEKAEANLLRSQKIQNELYNELYLPTRSSDTSTTGKKILKLKLDKAINNTADLMRSLNTERNLLEEVKATAANDRISGFRSYNCPPNMSWNSNEQRCDSFGNRAGILNRNKREMIQNRKKSFFNSIVE